VNGPSELSFLGERELRVRAKRVETLCRIIAVRLPKADPRIESIPFLAEPARALAFLRVSLDVAREEGVPPRLWPAFLQLLCLPRLVQENLPDDDVDWPTIPEKAIRGRTNKAQRMLHEALVVEDAGWLDCQVRGASRANRDDPMFDIGIWQVWPHPGQEVCGYPLRWSERLRSHALFFERRFLIGMWAPASARNNPRGATMNLWIVVSPTAADGGACPPESLPDEVKAEEGDLGERFSPRSPLRLRLERGLAAEVFIHIERRDLGERGILRAAAPRTLSLIASWDRPERADKASDRDSATIVHRAGYGSRTWGRPPRGDARWLNGTGDEGSTVREAEVNFSFSEIFGPHVHLGASGGWDSVPVRIGVADGALLIAAAWARQLPGVFRTELPIAQSQRRPDGAPEVRWFDAFTVAEQSALRDLLKHRLVAVGEVFLRRQTSEADLKSSLLTLRHEVAAIPWAALDGLFQRLTERFHASRRPNALRGYLLRWLNDHVEVTRNHALQLRQNRMLPFDEERPPRRDLRRLALLRRE
jgi:hypothetical protein